VPRRVADSPTKHRPQSSALQLGAQRSLWSSRRFSTLLLFQEASSRRMRVTPPATEQYSLRSAGRLPPYGARAEAGRCGGDGVNWAELHCVPASFSYEIRISPRAPHLTQNTTAHSCAGNTGTPCSNSVGSATSCPAEHRSARQAGNTVISLTPRGCRRFTRCWTVLSMRCRGSSARARSGVRTRRIRVGPSCNLSTPPPSCRGPTGCW
jgi:hypothetical protein